MSSLSESYLSSKHTNHEKIQTCGILTNILHRADHCEIFHTSMQNCRHSWNIQNGANLKKKYLRLNEIPTGKLQLLSSACSTSTLGMAQLAHSKTGLHNFNMIRSNGWIWISSRFEYFFGVVNSEYFPLGRQQWVFYEKPRSVELFQPEGPLSNILLQVVLQNDSWHAALQK